MSKTMLRSLLVTLFLAACAHRGAVRVDCEGPLRPINTPAPLKDAPVTVAPVNPDNSASGEKRP
jgi:hypothetical protein